MALIRCVFYNLDESDMASKGSTMNIVREEAIRLLNNLPDEASWDDVMYEMYVRNKIDKGVIAADKGLVVSHEEVRRRFIRK